MKILFVTSRNIVNTCGELRLIKNRTKTLYEEYGIRLDFFALKSDKVLKQFQEPIGCESTLRLFTYPKNFPVCLLSANNKMKKELGKTLKNNNYICAILSGANVLSLMDHIRAILPSIKIFVDIHGAYEELIEFKRNKCRN